MAFDTNLMYFAGTSDISASVSSSAITLYAIPVHGLGVRVSCPSGNASDDLVIKLHTSTDGSTYTEVSRVTANNVPAAGADYYIDLPYYNGKIYTKLELEVTGGTGFGAVVAGIDQFNTGVDRATHWAD